MARDRSTLLEPYSGLHRRRGCAVATPRRRVPGNNCLVVHLDVAALDVAGSSVFGVGPTREVDGEPVPVENPGLEARLTLIEHQDVERSLSRKRRVLGRVAALEMGRLGFDDLLARIGRFETGSNTSVAGSSASNLDQDVRHIAVEPDLGELQWHRGARESDLAGVVMVRDFALDLVRVAREVEAEVRSA